MDGAYHEQKLQVQHDLERVISKATQEPITKDEAALLSWAAGVKPVKEVASGN